MKNIIIVTHCMELGGAERALLGLLHYIDYKQYRVDLFLLHHKGELMKLIPPHVTVLPPKKEYTTLAVPIGKVIKQGLFKQAVGRCVGKFKAKRYIDKYKVNKENSIGLEYSHKYTKIFMPVISDKAYDLAISFLTPHYFVAEKVRAEHKIAWIHTDYSYIEIDVLSELLMWKTYEHIVSISEKVTQAFLSKFSTLESKIILIENMISPEFIKEQAELLDVSDEMLKDGNIINLLTIGRFSTPKRMEEIPFICKEILHSGVRVRWYIIGYGGKEDIIWQAIKETHMEEYVIVLGKKENPYPYIKNCDIYVQPSRYEGKAVTVREAQILCKPTVITDFPTASSQLEDGFDGIIVPLENKDIAKGIVDLIIDKEKQQTLIDNCAQSDYSNQSEMEKLYRLMGK